MRSKLFRLVLFLRAHLYALATVAAGLTVAATTAVANATATYGISPVTSSITSEISGNLATILLVVGGLLGLGIVIHLVRKFSKAS